MIPRRASFDRRRSRACFRDEQSSQIRETRTGLWTMFFSAGRIRMHVSNPDRIVELPSKADYQFHSKPRSQALIAISLTCSCRKLRARACMRPFFPRSISCIHSVRIAVGRLGVIDRCGLCEYVILPWPKKLKQARKPNIGVRMLDRSRACATCAWLFQFFWPG